MTAVTMRKLFRQHSSIKKTLRNRPEQQYNRIRSYKKGRGIGEVTGEGGPTYPGSTVMAEPSRGPLLRCVLLGNVRTIGRIFCQSIVQRYIYTICRK